MKEVNIIQLNNKEYALINEININGITYMHFSNTSNSKDFCIRKVVIKDGEEVITNLDNREEFDTAIREFAKAGNEFLEN